MARDAGNIAAVKARVDMVELVRRYVELRPASGRFVGLCPFHQEKTASFSVNPALGLFHCFGCKASGDVLDFYARINGLEFREALEALAEQSGVRLDGRGEDPAEVKRRNLRKACLAAHELAMGLFRRNLAGQGGQAARDYLERRRMAPEVVERFGLGHAPDEWQALHDALRDAGYAPEVGVEAGLLSRSQGGRVYDRFRGRLIFPIQDMAGRVIAFGGRIIVQDPQNEAPKYLNSSDSPIYTKGDHLYGLFQARRDMAGLRRVLVTEGYVDVLALHQHGFANAVGVLGTALTEAQVRRLGQMVSQVDLVFDGDAAGRAAALRSAPMILAQGLGCRVVLLPQGLDADDLLRQEGRSAFEALLERAAEGLDFCLETLRATAAPKEFLEFSRNFMRSLKDVALAAVYLPRLARGLGMAETELRRALQTGVAQAPRSVPPAQGRDAASPSRDRDLLAVAVRHPEHRQTLARQGFEELLAHPKSRALWAKLAAEGHQELDEDERRFVAEAAQMPRLSDEDAGRWLADVCACLARNRAREERGRLRAGMQQAAARGDKAEAARLLAQYQSLGLTPGCDRTETISPGLTEEG